VTYTKSPVVIVIVIVTGLCVRIAAMLFSFVYEEVRTYMVRCDTTTIRDMVAS